MNANELHSFISTQNGKISLVNKVIQAERLPGNGKDTIVDGGSIAPEGPNRHKRTLSSYTSDGWDETHLDSYYFY